ncbi:UDP-N-acetylmuramoyl-tripeptide--D-alanyl-D-alanine ligase [Paenalkalicoccus suaedae]|uniref:UDP-N-acetylmuramoyl-tripeptide--D-alanyl-D-alanine ligase n=1 Tax=Paenalkalicoccus suaedae TaxID=2592382 RepID=A0A859FCP8_9BACI|nr:UDP-N-acetylmuramoyl-tripeptide--D-alanyl-D-alanine ligase [Paenalkalicoccus suaedae]QKS70354.1 UDP-N-acetylmuramoyl-tripeptide--D-alanyl-D-alanine ligase [Paenalkalicoccus suaedae]
MIRCQVSEVAAWTNGEVVGDGAIEIAGVSTDTRSLVGGNLYVPLAGERFDGHDFYEHAAEAGAVATLWSKQAKDRPSGMTLVLVDDTLDALQLLAENYLDSLATRVVAVTGSNGKTTTKDMLASVLGTSYKVHKTQGNFNNHIGLPLTILAMERDTEVAVLEMGMNHRGEIELLSKLAKPDVAVITNIGESHLENLGTREGIAEAKFEITAGLKSDGVLVIHGDEPLLTPLVADVPFTVETFGTSSECGLVANDIVQGKSGTDFTFDGDAFYIPVLGKHNVNNALASIAVGRAMHVPVAAMQQGLRELAITGMRTELIEGANGVTLINDAYNASPTSVAAAVSLLETMEGYSQRIVVLADMLELGEEEEAFHEKVGRELNPEKVDYVFTFGKLGQSIATGASERFQEGKVFSFTDKTELVEVLSETVTRDAIVLVKGSRGMRLEEVVQELRA